MFRNKKNDAVCENCLLLRKTFFYHYSHLTTEKKNEVRWLFFNVVVFSRHVVEQKWKENQTSGCQSASYRQQAGVEKGHNNYSYQ